MKCICCNLYIKSCDQIPQLVMYNLQNYYYMNSLLYNQLYSEISTKKWETIIFIELYITEINIVESGIKHHNPIPILS